MLKNITLRQLRTFSAVIEHGTMAAAAHEIGLTPPAVSLQIKQLEENLGIALLERTSEGLHITEAGQLLRDAHMRIDAALGEAGDAIGELTGLQRGRAAIGVVSTGKYVVPQALAAFAREHPALDLKLTVGNRGETVAALAGYRVDMAVMGRPPTGFQVDCEEIGEHPHVIIAAPDHPLAGDRHIAAKRLLQENLLMREPGSGTRALVMGLFEKAGLTAPEGMEMGSNETIKQAVMAGLGIALISAHTVAAELKDGRLKALDVEGLPIRRAWFVVKRRDKRLLPAAAALWEFLINEGARFLPAT